MRRARLVWETIAGVVRRDPVRVELAQILWDKETLRVNGSSHVDMEAAWDLAVKHGCSPIWAATERTGPSAMEVHGSVGSLMSFGCSLQGELGYEETV